MTSSRITLVAFVALLGMVAQPPGEQVTPPGEQPTPPGEAFTQGISGTVVEIEMVPIPAGSIEVPDAEHPGRTKAIKVGPFYASTTEIAWDSYDVFVYHLDEPAGGGEGGAADGPQAVTRPTKPYIPPDRGFGHAGFPTISVTFKGAREYCVWLSKKTGRTYRLPTEAEWEYMTRGGAAPSAPYCFGDDEKLLDEYAWYTDNANRKTQPVGRKKPNAWGLFDVHGNVGEWCVGLDGQPIACGGAFLNKAKEVTLTRRDTQTPLWNITDPQMPKSTWWLSDCNFVGFRIICEPQGATPDESGEGGGSQP